MVVVVAPREERHREERVVEGMKAVVVPAMPPRRRSAPVVFILYCFVRMRERVCVRVVVRCR
jgi:hypothetical protein